MEATDKKGNEKSISCVHMGHKISIEDCASGSSIFSICLLQIL